MIEFIRQMPYFRSLTSLKIKGLINSLQKVEYARGNIVIKEDTKHQEDDVFFIIEGEFAEIQTFNLEDNQIDSMSKEQQQNREFHKSKEKQFLIHQNLELQSVQSQYHNRVLKNTIDLRKCQRGLLTNTMQKNTRNMRLLQKKFEKQEVILSKYGPGKVLGEAIHVIPELESKQPYSIKCLSLDGVLVRISKFEFEKKVLCHQKVLNIFRENAIDNIINN